MAERTRGGRARERLLQLVRLYHQHQPRAAANRHRLYPVSCLL